MHVVPPTSPRRTFCAPDSQAISDGGGLVNDINVRQLAAMLKDNADTDCGSSSDSDVVITEAQAAVLVSGPGTDTPNSVTMAAIKMAR